MPYIEVVCDSSPVFPHPLLYTGMTIRNENIHLYIVFIKQAFTTSQTFQLHMIGSTNGRVENVHAINLYGSYGQFTCRGTFLPGHYQS